MQFNFIHAIFFVVEFIGKVNGRITNAYLSYDQSFEDKDIKAAIPKSRSKKERVIDITNAQIQSYRRKKGFYMSNADNFGTLLDDEASISGAYFDKNVVDESFHQNLFRDTLYDHKVRLSYPIFIFN